MGLPASGRPQSMVAAREGTFGQPTGTTTASSPLATTLRSPARAQQPVALAEPIGRRQQLAAASSLGVNMGADTMMIKRPALEPVRFAGDDSSLHSKQAEADHPDKSDEEKSVENGSNEPQRHPHLSLASFQERHKQLAMKNKQHQQQQSVTEQPSSSAGPAPVGGNGSGEQQASNHNRQHKYRQQATTFASALAPHQAHELATESINHHVTARLDRGQPQARLKGNGQAAEQPVSRRQLESGPGSAGQSADDSQRGRPDLLYSPATLAPTSSSQSFAPADRTYDQLDQLNLQRQDRQPQGASALSEQNDNQNSNQNNNNQHMMSSFNLQQGAPAGSLLPNYDQQQQQQQQQISPATGVCYTPLSLLAVILVTMLATIVLCYVAHHLIKHLSFHQFGKFAPLDAFNHPTSASV